jgi:hypothetical protein
LSSHLTPSSIRLGLPFLSLLDAAVAPLFCSGAAADSCSPSVTPPPTSLPPPDQQALKFDHRPVASLLSSASSVIFDPCHRLHCSVVPPDPTRTASPSSASSATSRHQARARRAPSVVVYLPVAASPALPGHCAVSPRFASRAAGCRLPLHHWHVSDGVELAQIQPPSLGLICSLASPRQVLLKLLRLGPVLESPRPSTGVQPDRCSSLFVSAQIRPDSIVSAQI